MAKKKRIPHKFLPWIDARKRFKLSDAHIQMARELGLSPKRFGRYADRTKEPWKLPLSEFIEFMYTRQFGKERPDEVRTMEEIAAAHVEKRAARKVENAQMDVATEQVAVESESSTDESPVGGSDPIASESESPADDATDEGNTESQEVK